MAKPSLAEKLERKRAELERALQQQAALQHRITELKKSIAEMETFEIVALTKELNMPTTELRSLLVELKNKHQNL